jgi:hypothetical protein
MTLSTLAELRASVRDWAKRSSLGDSLIHDFVTMTETALNNGERADDGTYLVFPLRVRDMETIATLTVTDGAATLPSDFLEAITVRNPGEVTYSLQYVTPEFMADRYPTGQNTVSPADYTIVGSTLYSPIDLELRYYARIPPLVADGTNWLLQKAPNVYLYGCLSAYSAFDKDPEKYTGYRQLMNAALGGLNAADVNSRAGSMTRRASMAVC